MKKEKAALETRTAIMQFLKDKYVDKIPPEIILEIAEHFSREYIKKIKIEIVDEWHYGVRFYCNLSPEEMEEREEEARLFLPRTNASEDYKFNVALLSRKVEMKFLPCLQQDGRWIYYAFP